MNLTDKHEHVHGPDCDHDHEEDEDVIIVSDEDGNEHELVMVYTFQMDGHAYGVLIDRNDPEADGFIYKIVEEEDAAVLVDIEDENEWNRAAAFYNDVIAAEEGK
jgi:uncharacterized protein YrzB (UPF0473 family)